MLHAIVILVGPYPLVCAAREPKLPRVRIAPVALRGDLNVNALRGACVRGLLGVEAAVQNSDLGVARIDGGPGVPV